MHAIQSFPHALTPLTAPPAAPPPAAGSQPPGDELRAAFDDFVGQAFYGQLLAAMRKTVGKPAYFHGGRAEETFQQQLDQMLAEHVSDASADRFTGPMFELFTLARR